MRSRCAHASPWEPCTGSRFAHASLWEPCPRSWCAPWDPHLISQPASPIPTNTPRANHHRSCHCRSTARLPGDTLRSRPPSAPSAGKGRSCLCWKLNSRGSGRPRAARSLPPPLAASRREARLARAGCSPAQQMRPEQPCQRLARGARQLRVSPAARRGNFFPGGLPVQAVSLLPPSKRPPAEAGRSLAGSRPGRQPARRAASGPGARQPLLSRGRAATEKSAHLGSRCERARGAGGRAAASSLVLRAPRCTRAEAAACLHAG